MKAACGHAAHWGRWVELLARPTLPPACGDTDHSHWHLLCKHHYNCSVTSQLDTLSGPLQTHSPLWRALRRTRKRLRTLANDRHNCWRTQPHPQTPKVKREPSLSILEYTLTCHCGSPVESRHETPRDTRHVDPWSWVYGLCHQPPPGCRDYCQGLNIWSNDAIESWSVVITVVICNLSYALKKGRLKFIEPFLALHIGLEPPCTLVGLHKPLARAGHVPGKLSSFRSSHQSWRAKENLLESMELWHQAAWFSSCPNHNDGRSSPANRRACTCNKAARA